MQNNILIQNYNKIFKINYLYYLIKKNIFSLYVFINIYQINFKLLLEFL